MTRLLLYLAASVLLALGCGGPKKIAECKNDRDCKLGQVCQETGQVCITASCEFCTDGQVCYKPTPESEGSCSAPPDCSAGECTDMGEIDAPDMETPEPDMPPTDVPCASLIQQAIDFGAVEVGEAATLSVAVENCSESAPLSVDGSELGPFTLEPADISPGTTADVQITFAPTESGTFSSELLLATSAGSFRVTASGDALAFEDICPVPVIEAGEGNVLEQRDTLAFVVGTTVTLSAAQSQAPLGVVAGYEWSVVDRPAESMAMLADPMAEETTLELDALGEYNVDLTVTDGAGNEACAPTRVTLSAAESIPTRFRIVMTWDTPADMDQTDANGTDVDLHYLHPMGEWNMPPYDVFWNNPAPTWPGSIPKLTIDDTDGAGPEEIEHDAPVTDVDYQIGVYYYADNGLGPSYATIQVYVDGVLGFELTDNFMAGRGTFWGPFVLSGLDGTVSDDNAVTQSGFPSP